MSEERGYTLVELLVGVTVSLVVLGAVMTIVQAATRQQDRVAERVTSNQRGRPVMTRIVDRLHSACVSPGLAPIQAGSGDSSMILLSKSGDAVSPVPDKYDIGFAEGKLTETVYPGTGGEPGEWTFGSPNSRELLDGVTTAKLGESAEGVPVFRYYTYEGGEVEDEPLPTPLSEEDAALTVQVDIAFTVAPNGNGSADQNTPIALSDSATLRIEPASEDSAEVNLPCV